jgi:hypothetical protein
VFVWWCLAPLSTIFQLYRDGQFYWETGGPGENHRPVASHKLYHIMLYSTPWSRFELTTSVVIGTDCLGNCKSNYHMITATTTGGTVYICYISISMSIYNHVWANHESLFDYYFLGIYNTHMSSSDCRSPREVFSVSFSSELFIIRSCPVVFSQYPGCINIFVVVFSQNLSNLPSNDLLVYVVTRRMVGCSRFQQFLE